MDYKDKDYEKYTGCHHELDSDETGSHETRRRPLIWKITALLVLVTFASLSLPNLAQYLSSQYDYLKQNQELRNDPVVTKVSPAVTSVKAYAGPGQTTRLGTGCNIEPEGLVITNWHVVENVTQVEVSFGDGQVFMSNKIAAVQDADLALIMIEGRELPCIPVFKGSRIKSGQEVTVIGNPQGFERISQRGFIDEVISNGEGRLLFTIEVSAQPGSSGSAVLNDKGELVGIVYASIMRDDKKRALAIPLSDVAYELNEAQKEIRKLGPDV